ncbi:hypothetical protein [Paenibacillus alvei]|uniref:Uncharacterized protein n=1 Tax=Paenibacillus alvei TaxID=44250 RepID=A0A383R8K5_PAEAL|nr:hypothetical protein [Paenibacillus alvei]SYX83435.1 protein of unknown function [Paenibacillus alvei]
MPIVPLTRMSSSNVNTFVGLNRASAIAQARVHSGVKATDVGRVTPLWPRLLKYENDDAFVPLFPDPKYVWDSFTTTPQIRFFAQGFSNIFLNVDEQIFVSLTVFCDNAHDVKIDIFDETNGDLFTTITPAANEIPLVAWNSAFYYVDSLTLQHI